MSFSLTKLHVVEFPEPFDPTPEQEEKLRLAQQIIGYRFTCEQLLLSEIGRASCRERVLPPG